MLLRQPASRFLAAGSHRRLRPGASGLVVVDARGDWPSRPAEIVVPAAGDLN